MASPLPCDTCEDKPCIAVCPAKALNQGDLNLPACLDYRLESHSRCKSQCLSRIICPIAKEHRYSQEQINYHYAISMKMIEAYQWWKTDPNDYLSTYIFTLWNFQMNYQCFLKHSPLHQSQCFQIDGHRGQKKKYAMHLGKASRSSPNQSVHHPYWAISSAA